jgi:hypothetical protein
MRIPREVWSGPLLIGAVVLAGCGGSAGGAPQETGGGPVTSAAYRTPQSAVHGYIKGIEGRNGGLVCSSLTSSLRHVMVNYTVQSGIAEAGDSCAEALGALAGRETKAGRQDLRLPRFHVSVKGTEAVVGYIGPRTHKQHVFGLVKGESGWLITKINGEG